MLKVQGLLCGFFMLMNITASAQTDTVYWSDQPPGEQQFRMGYPSAETRKKLSSGKRYTLEGYIYSGIRFSYTQENEKITYVVIAYMLPDQSWLKDHDDKPTLEHEQAHFALTEIYARRLRKELSHVCNSKVARKMMHQNFDELEEVQHEFDKAHKSESGVLPEWRTRIANEMNALLSWADSSVSCGR